MASKSISAKIKKEGDIVNIEGFATNVGILDIKWGEDYNRIIIDFVNDQGQTARKSIYGGDKWKSEDSKNKAMNYRIREFADICQSILPGLKLVDTNDLRTAFEEYVTQVAQYLPTIPDGELKLVFRPDKETKLLKGKFYNYSVSSDAPCYSNPTKKQTLKFSDKDKTLLSWEVWEPKPDEEVVEEAVGAPAGLPEAVGDKVPF